VLRLANDAASGGLRRAGYESFGIHAPEAPLMHGSTHLGLDRLYRGVLTIARQLHDLW